MNEYENFIANIMPQNMIFMTNLFQLRHFCHFQSNQVHFSHIGLIIYVNEDVQKRACETSAVQITPLRKKVFCMIDRWRTTSFLLMEIAMRTGGKDARRVRDSSANLLHRS
jgi:hypothetical protein